MQIHSKEAALPNRERLAHRLLCGQALNKKHFRSRIENYRTRGHLGCPSKLSDRCCQLVLVSLLAFCPSGFEASFKAQTSTEDAILRRVLSYRTMPQK